MTSLSLPPSGKMPFSQTKEGLKCFTEPSHNTEHGSPFIAPVFGTISNRDVPIMSSKGTTTDPLLTATKSSNKSEGSTGRRISKTLSGIKRRQPDVSDSEEVEEVFDIVGKKKKEKRQNLEDSLHWLRQNSRDDSCDENQKDGAGVKIKKELLGHHLNVHLPQSPSTRSTFLSCLHRKPRVVLERLSLTTRGGNWSGLDQAATTVSPVKTSARRASSQHPKSSVDFSTRKNKE